MVKDAVTFNANNVSRLLSSAGDTKQVMQGGLMACIARWQQPHHLLLHISMALTLIGFLAPSRPFGLVVQHSCFVVGFMLQAVWAWSLTCAPDTFSWDISFVIINLLQLCLVLYSLRPIRFSSQLEDVYKTLFEPLHTPRLLFRKLTSAEVCSISELKAGQVYAKQDHTHTNRLSLLISGTVTVHCNGQLLHQIREKQFLDSPEFEATIKSDEVFHVSLVASSECRLLVWQRHPLEVLFSKEPYLAAIMDALLGRDVTNKLYSMATVGDKARKATTFDLRLPCSIDQPPAAGGVEQGHTDSPKAAAKVKASKKHADNYQANNNYREDGQRLKPDNGSNGKHVKKMASYGAAWPQAIKTNG